jgi:hypothetical protein
VSCSFGWVESVVLTIRSFLKRILFSRGFSSGVPSSSVVDVTKCIICGCILTDDNRSVDLVNCCRRCAHSLES